MKKFKNLPASLPGFQEGLAGNARVAILLKGILFAFMMSWALILPSCAVEVQTPQPERHRHVFIRHYHSEPNNYKKNYGHDEHKEKYKEKHNK
jgi:hypothetical protein